MFFSVIFILIVSACFIKAQEPLSTCLFARATKGGSTGNTCGFNKAKSQMSGLVENGGVIMKGGADDETYNGFPWLAPTQIPVSGTSVGTGQGQACGECFELIGAKGSMIMMVYEVCDKTCAGCATCQGSLGGDPNLGTSTCGDNCGPDVQQFGFADDSYGQQMWSTLGARGGNHPIAYRKVACPLKGQKIGYYVAYYGPSSHEITFYNYRVGLKNVEISTGSHPAYQSLKRGWTNKWLFVDQGNADAPIKYRLTSIFDEVIETAEISDIDNTDLHTLNIQFTQNFPSNVPATCDWPGPSSEIFTDETSSPWSGEHQLKWLDGSGGPSVVQVDYITSASQCNSGNCLKITFNNFNFFQMFFNAEFNPLELFDGIEFWAKGETTGKVSLSFRTVTSSAQLGSSIKIDLTTSWVKHTFAMSEFGLSNADLVGRVIFQKSGSNVVWYLDGVHFTGGRTTVVPSTDPLGIRSGPTNPPTDPPPPPPTNPPTNPPTQAPTDVVVANDVDVYRGTLSSFVRNWSWSCTITDSVTFMGSTALKAVYSGNWGGLYLACSGGSNCMNILTLKVKLVVPNGRTIRLNLIQDGGTFGSGFDFDGTGDWMEISKDASVFGLSGNDFSGINLQLLERFESTDIIHVEYITFETSSSHLQPSSDGNIIGLSKYILFFGSLLLFVFWF